MEQAFDYARKHRISIIKTGYVAPLITTNDGVQWNKGQSGVRHYRKVIETAARYHISIDNHEPVMPTGLQRTYPNLMTQEGVRGQEWNAWSADGGNPCAHVCTLPFTRLMAGPMDYTPGVFRLDYHNNHGPRVHGTLMNQLGLFVCLYSPLQMACDLPEHYMEHPDAFRFIEQVPCDWEQSILLDGKIGEYCIYARRDRHSNTWYIGGVTDQQRDVTLDLSRLGLEKNIAWEAVIYQDASDADWQTNPYAYHIDTLSLASTLPAIHMAQGGGFAVRISPTLPSLKSDLPVLHMLRLARDPVNPDLMILPQVASPLTTTRITRSSLPSAMPSSRFFSSLWHTARGYSPAAKKRITEY